MFISSYCRLGYDSRLEDWNVRFSEGEIRLDNLQNESTAFFFTEDNVLFVEVSAWSSQGNKTKSQNICLNDLSTGWRDSSLNPIKNPSIEAVSFLEHLKKLELDVDIACPEYAHFDGMRSEDFNSFLDC